MTPRIYGFFLGTNAEANKKVFDDLWDNIYKDNKYSDLYCMYKGGILILGDTSAINKKQLSGFTVRNCWALKGNVKNGRDTWTWMCETPQVISYNSKTKEQEEISISAGVLANTSMGRSYVFKKGEPPLGILPDGSTDDFHFNLETTPYGLFFAEQMKTAMKYDPYVVLVTEWNEWGAGRWETDAPGVLIAGTYMTNNGEAYSKSYYVECFNEEFSRDIEPEDGRLRDDYYYQLAQFIKEFKGTRGLPETDEKTIDLAKDASQWSDVWPEYRDARTDIWKRDNDGYLCMFHYTNDSGRNDIISAKATADGSFLYFYVKCASDITSPEGVNWMNLYIDADMNYETGWEGYDFVLCRDASSLISGGKVSIHRFVNNSRQFESIGTANARLDGNMLVISVLRADLGLSGDTLTFDFKWADNSVSDGDPMKFIDMGDAAPDGRFNYRFTTAPSDTSVNEALTAVTSDGAAFCVGRSYMLAGGKLRALCSSDTSVTAEFSHNRIFVPAGSLDGAASITVKVEENQAIVTRGGVTLVFTDGSAKVLSGIDTIIIPVAPYTSGGELYIPLNVCANYFGLTFMSDSLGRALITSVSPENIPAGILNEAGCGI